VWRTDGSPVLSKKGSESGGFKIVGRTWDLEKSEKKKKKWFPEARESFRAGEGGRTALSVSYQPNPNKKHRHFFRGIRVKSGRVRVGEKAVRGE